METVYLKNGQEAYLVDTTDSGKFIVEPIFQYRNEHDELFDDSMPPTIVDEIFKTKPIEKIDADILLRKHTLKSFDDKLALIKKEYSETNGLLSKAKTELTNLEKWKVDLSQFKTCKKIIFFVDKQVQPIIIKDKPPYSDRYWNLHFTISVWDAKPVIYSVGYSQDGSGEYKRDYSGAKIDDKYGFMFDLSDDEIIRITKERSESIDLDKLDYMSKCKSINEIYQTDRIKEHIAKEVEQSRINTIEAAKKEIERNQAIINKLTTQPA